jgi:hypothetical protein
MGQAVSAEESAQAGNGAMSWVSDMIVSIALNDRPVVES